MHELGKLEGLRWMRILYAYPSYFTEKLVEEIATNPKASSFPHTLTLNEYLSSFSKTILAVYPCTYFLSWSLAYGLALALLLYHVCRSASTLTCPFSTSTTSLSLE